jgi:hypothetical protein
MSVERDAETHRRSESEPHHVPREAEDSESMLLIVRPTYSSRDSQVSALLAGTFCNIYCVAGDEVA